MPNVRAGWPAGAQGHGKIAYGRAVPHAARGPARQIGNPKSESNPKFQISNPPASSPASHGPPSRSPGDRPPAPPGRPAGGGGADLSANPGRPARHAGAWHLLGVIAHQSGQHETAVGLINRAIVLNGQVPTSITTSAKCIVPCGRSPKRWPATAGPWNSDRTMPPHITTWAMRARPGQAGRSGDLLSPGPGTPTGLCRRIQQSGQCAERPGQTGRSGSVLPPGLELQPDYAEAYNNLANVHHDQGRPDDALACIRRALDLKPDYAAAHNNLGNLLRRGETPTRRRPATAGPWNSSRTLPRRTTT